MMSMTPDQFIATVALAAQQSSKKTGIPASFTIAEAALESGWGSSQLAAQACNLFGVKADASWPGPTVSMPTREFLAGLWQFVPATWRKYADWQACFDDHAIFLQTNGRYASAFLYTNGEDFAQAVQAAGYATDPNYAAKLIAVMRQHDLASFDAPARIST
jgi:flagellar rod assembly protein/muramidase FlgJ